MAYCLHRKSNERHCASILTSNRHTNHGLKLGKIPHGLPNHSPLGWKQILLYPSTTPYCIGHKQYKISEQSKVHALAEILVSLGNWVGSVTLPINDVLVAPHPIFQEFTILLQETIHETP